MAGCNQGAHVKTKKGEWKTVICLNYLSDGGYEFTREEILEMERARKAAQEKEMQERNNKIVEISNMTINGMPTWAYYHDLLLQNKPLVLELLEHDGLTIETLKAFQVGYNPEFRVYHKEDDSEEFFETITFPHFHRLQINGKWDYWMTNIRHRLLGASKNKYRPLMSGLGVDYFNANIPGFDRLVILEGEKKALRLWQEGISAVGIWGTQAWYDWWIAEWVRMAPIQIVVLFDHEADPAKQEMIWEHGQKLVAAINFKKAKIASQALLPEIGKIDDQYMTGQMDTGKLIQLLESVSPVQIR